MSAYTSFAQVYDTFMNTVPYEEWGNYIMELLKAYDINNGLVLDLGCGTGTFTGYLSQNGYDMIGIDNSEDMLSIAMDKAAENKQSILYLLQDMRNFELYGTVKAVISICDSLNYIIKEEDLTKVFTLVNNYLDPGGIFLFDLNTEYKYEHILSDHTFAENQDEGSFIWENYYDRETKINEYDLTLFIKNKNEQYDKFEETHYQRAYSLEEIKKCLEAAGLEFLTVFQAFSFSLPGEEEERIYIIAREKGK